MADRKDLQPNPFFARTNLLVVAFLRTQLKPQYLEIIDYLILGMDRDNIFECCPDSTFMTDISERFKIDKKNLFTIMKKISDLGIYIKLDNGRVRFNPYIANKLAELPSLWEFEKVKMDAIFDKGFAVWMLRDGVAHISLASYQRLVKGMQRATTVRAKRDAMQLVIDTMTREHTEDYSMWLQQRDSLTDKIDSLTNTVEELKTLILDKFKITDPKLCEEIEKISAREKAHRVWGMSESTPAPH